MRKILVLLMLGMIFILPACTQKTSETTTDTPEIIFDPKITMIESGTVVFKLGVANMNGPDQAVVEDVNIQAVITNETGNIRNKMTIVDLPSIPAGESVYPLTYEAVYDPGRYLMSITGEDIPSLSLNFEIREVDGLLKLAASPEYIDPHTGYTIDDLDL